MMDYLQSLKADGISVEFYFQWNDPDLKKALITRQYKGSAACAALSYRWVRRQLSKGVLATPDQPIFKELSQKKLAKIATDQVKHAQYTQLEFEIKEKGYQPTGYQAIIKPKDKLVCGLIGEGRFQDFVSEAASDKNIDELGWWIEGTVDAAYAVERRVREKYGKTKPEEFDEIANQFPDFFGILAVRGVSGHAMGLRHDPWTGVVHFFDPNFGHFRFPSWHVFREKLKPYWRYGYMDPGKPAPVFPKECRFKNYYLIQYRKEPLGCADALSRQWFSISGPEGATDEQIELLKSLKVPTG
ncbi:MAG TPA: YopT-type cysteine protease domain-containing protein [Terrimicrobiaceae bacterium]